MAPCSQCQVLKATYLWSFTSNIAQVQLNFVASFMFTASLFGWTFYSAPALEVTTQLTTETAKGRQLGGKGSRMDADGFARWAPRIVHALACILLFQGNDDIIGSIRMTAWTSWQADAHFCCYIQAGWCGSCVKDGRPVHGHIPATPSQRLCRHVVTVPAVKAASGSK